MRTKTLKLSILLAALPAAALASGGGSANPWLDVVFKFVNFAVLMGIFYFSLRKVIPQALSDRRDNIAKDLKEARAAKEEAETKLAEYKAKVANLETEIATIKADFKAEGEAQRVRILEQAERSAEQLRKNAAAIGEREAKMAADSIREEAVAQALALAEEILAKAYGGDDQKRAIDKTIEKIEGLH